MNIVTEVVYALRDIDSASTLIAFCCSISKALKETLVIYSHVPFLSYQSTWQYIVQLLRKSVSMFFFSFIVAAVITNLVENAL